METAQCQPQTVVSEIGEWKCEKDLDSRWEFTRNGKLYTTYIGTDSFDSYTYEILSTKPICPDVQLAVEPNIKYLKIIDDEDGQISCFYIYALNDNRFTVMDALSGHILPFLRVD